VVPGQTRISWFHWELEGAGRDAGFHEAVIATAAPATRHRPANARFLRGQQGTDAAPCPECGGFPPRRTAHDQARDWERPDATSPRLPRRRRAAGGPPKGEPVKTTGPAALFNASHEDVVVTAASTERVGGAGVVEAMRRRREERPARARRGGARRFLVMYRSRFADAGRVEG